MKIYIVRHGETKANVNGSLCGWIDNPLNENGIELAKQTGRALKGVKFDVAYSSSLSRAYDTAKIVLEESENDCSILVDDRLKEIHMGDLEGCNVNSDFDKKYKNMISDFVNQPFKLERFPNGENVYDVINRTQDFLRDIIKKDYSTVLIASHGCALRAMLNFLYEDKDNFWQDGVPLNCCINIVEAENGDMKLVEKDLILYDKSLCVDRFKNFIGSNN